MRLCYDWHISQDFVSKIAAAKACKILFIRDEYDNTALARRWMKKLGVNVVFTCVPEEFIETVYPSAELPGIRFIPTLTGWVSSDFERNSELRPVEGRANWINYRGRNLPSWYGDLGREKKIVGERMRQECISRNVPCDIEWNDDMRVYGPVWLEFIQQAGATVGSESGSNVFDVEGAIRAAIEEALVRNPLLTYEELHKQYIGSEDGRVKMNQVSPRVFEAAALGTGLVLFCGEYSGVVQPGEHFIPLEKDFSNVDEVFEKLGDVDLITRMVKRTRARRH